jgi:cathepsin L
MLVCLLGLGCCRKFSVFVSQYEKKLFKEFTEDLGVTYVGEEYFLRLGIFVQNLNRIRQTNAAYHTGEAVDGETFHFVRYTLAPNKFAVYTPAEYRALLGWRPRPRGFPASGLTPTLLTGSTTLDGRSWDTQVLTDQGRCAGGWAFAAAGAIRSVLPPSVQQLLDCSTSAGGCRYGNVVVAYQYLFEHGIASENDYAHDVDLLDWGAVRTQGCRYSGVATYKLGRFDQINPTEADVTGILGEQGPIAVAVDASAHSFQFYHSGVYNDPFCSQTELNHAMLLVGFGTTDDKLPYWKLLNWFGSGWGETGFIRILRRGNYCGVTTEAIIPTLKT